MTTAATRKSGRVVAVDKKAAFMVQEFRKYGARIVGISETKWFGQEVDVYEVSVYDVDVYEVDEYEVACVGTGGCV